MGQLDAISDEEIWKEGQRKDGFVLGEGAEIMR
jgi:hypothetical protein